MLSKSKLTTTLAPGAVGQRKWTAAFLPVALRDKYAPSTIALAMALIELHYNRSTGQLDPGYPTLAAELGVSERTVMRAVAELKAGGWVLVHRLGRKDHAGFTLTIPNHEVTPDVTSNETPNPVFEVTRNGSRGDTEGGFEVTSVVTANEHLNTYNTSDPSLRSGSGALTRAKPKATRMIEGWQPSQKAWDYANRIMPKGPVSLADREVEKFRDHWLADAGPRAWKRDWNAAFRLWARRAAEFHQRNETQAVLAANKRRIERERSQEPSWDFVDHTDWGHVTAPNTARGPIIDHTPAKDDWWRTGSTMRSSNW